MPVQADSARAGTSTGLILLTASAAFAGGLVGSWHPFPTPGTDVPTFAAGADCDGCRSDGCRCSCGACRCDGRNARPPRPTEPQARKPASEVCPNCRRRPGQPRPNGPVSPAKVGTTCPVCNRVIVGYLPDGRPVKAEVGDAAETPDETDT